MGIKKKLRQYADYKRISYRKFSIRIGKSDKFIASDGEIQSDVFINIRKYFPDLNINWLLFDEGDMITDSNKISKNNSSNVSEEDFALIKKALSHALISYDEIKEELHRLKTEIRQ